MSSLLPLNGKNLELGGFSIGYVHITSEPTDNQVSSFSPVGTILYRYVQFATSERQGFELATPNQLCPYYLWTDGYLDLSLMVLKLSCPVHHLWTDKSITLSSFPLSRSGVLTVMLIRLPLNSKLWAWCLLVGHVHITSEPTGAQIQFTIAVPSGLAAKLMWLPLAADSEFSVS